MGVVRKEKFAVPGHKLFFLYTNDHQIENLSYDTISLPDICSTMNAYFMWRT